MLYISEEHYNALQCHLIPIAALTQSIENELVWWKIELKNFAAFRCFFSSVSTTAPLWKIERKMSHLDIAFDRYASIGTVKVGLYRTRPRTRFAAFSVVAFCMNDFSLFYLDHSFANAAKPRSRGRVLYKQTLMHCILVISEREMDTGQML